MHQSVRRSFLAACLASSCFTPLAYADDPAARHAAASVPSALPVPQLDAVVSVGDLPAQVRGARGVFTPQTEGAVQAAKRHLAEAAARLERYLATGGANGAAWKRYLKWDEMQAQLRPGVVADLAVLEQVYRRYLADHTGLELPVWRNVAAALRSYIDLSAALAEQQPEQAFEAELVRLADHLESYGKTGNSEDLERAGTVLGWLERRRQAMPLVRAVRQRLSRPNLLVCVSDDLIAAGTGRSIDETDGVCDVILGTTIRGLGRTVGKVRVQLAPAADRALLETILEATNNARTVGSNGPARIGSTSRTLLVGRQQFAIDEQGFHPLPPRATASAHSHINSVWSTKRGLVDRVVRKVARKRIPQQKRQSEQIASRHAEQRLIRRLDADVKREINVSNSNYFDKFRNPLVRVGQFPRQLAFSTTSDQFRLTALHDGPDRLAAPSPPPEISAHADLTIRFHESLPNNFAQGLLAGQTLDRDQFERLALRYLGRIPEQLHDEEPRGPWSITFAAFNPITLRVDKELVVITVRGREFASDVRRFDVEMNVTARYRIENQAGVLKAVRQGELEIFPPGFVANSGQRLPTRLIGIRNLLKHRFDKIFAAEVVGQGLTPPGQWQRVGRLDLVQLDTDRGWMALGWRPAENASRLARRNAP